MMNGMYHAGLAMMITSTAAALAVLALAIVAIAWLACDLTNARRGLPGCQPQPRVASAEKDAR